MPRPEEDIGGMSERDQAMMRVSEGRVENGDQKPRELQALEKEKESALQALETMAKKLRDQRKNLSKLTGY
ncbi:MAG: hypothetical protein A3E98_01980 [Candidatus Doudnabacteria bacterium RIFCSPHIGHO2_12_FULL_48_11]|uniref:Uncharacterized protein n=1 Tax=Candidatus Doudnabacteria bacterium RIFCSPHIGHO2_01_FULL_46_24 TaxID=1817825 RepID=A0A1F5NU57_9BACT|nr:MAG: hypothetical protein A2720_01520 [Candidatus Doudnabacteria bacterium RIFCSPHIGHO2_01_FULL_46_24]OGE95672.1 MAG: hypothetical protein A3E98_01980 [Candidatus Doudnabacteria bacterium RIFCSPHIGHO2_12_FULL_48_11]